MPRQKKSKSRSPPRSPCSKNCDRKLQKKSPRGSKIDVWQGRAIKTSRGLTCEEMEYLRVNGNRSEVADGIAMKTRSGAQDFVRSGEQGKGSHLKSIYAVEHGKDVAKYVGLDYRLALAAGKSEKNQKHYENIVKNPVEYAQTINPKAFGGKKSPKKQTQKVPPLSSPESPAPKKQTQGTRKSQRRQK